MKTGLAAVEETPRPPPLRNHNTRVKGAGLSFCKGLGWCGVSCAVNFGKSMGQT